VQAFMNADLQFHTAILYATGNPLFGPVAHVIHAALQYSLQVTNRQPADNIASLPVHENVADAICNHDPDQARAAMHDHLNSTAARLQRAVADQQDRTRS